MDDKSKNHKMLHSGIHFGEYPYHCEHCGKGFGTREKLNKHVRIYTGENLNMFSLCGKSFSQRVFFVSYERIHSGWQETVSL